jgi:uncharacterized membrane protein (GlpM family)
MEMVARFVIGGVVVSFFALLGDLLKPKSFAGLFGAAPSVALATLGLAIVSHGKGYAAVECRSMIGGAAALGVYSFVVCRLLVRHKMRPLTATLACLSIWFGISFGLLALLR